MPIHTFRHPTRLGPCRWQLCAVVIAAALWHAGAHAQSYTRQQLQELFASHLRSESLEPVVDAAGNVRFRSQGRIYVIQVNEADPLYFRLRLSFVADDRSEAARVRHLEACNVASAEIKVVKCFLDEEGDPNFAAEMFVIVPGDFKASFSRMLRAVDSARDRFTRTVSEMR